MSLEAENTLRGFHRAFELGVQAVEMDVRCAKDGFVVVHDDTIDRTTNGVGSVADLTVSEIQHYETCAGEPIPTVDDVLSSLPRDACINFELKGEGSWRVVKSLDLSGDRFLFSSFSFDELRGVRREIPHARVACLAFFWHDSILDFAKELGAFALSVATSLAVPRLTSLAHREGMRVFTFAVNDLAQAQSFRRIGVDGLFTGDPITVNLTNVGEKHPPG